LSIVADNICLHLAGFDLLRTIDLSVEAGQVTVLVGPNGAGKSSLLKVLTGELNPSQGSVYLNQLELSQWDIQQKANVLAVLPQHSELNFPFTATEVVGLGCIPHTTGYAVDQKIITEALAMVDASYLQRRLYTQMSGGEKQRVQLARVLAQVWTPSDFGEQFLVLDEPTAAFDLAHQQMTLDIVRQFAARGVGVLMVLHDLNLAARCADNLVVVNGGMIEAYGSPAQVLTEHLVEKVFAVKATITRHPIADTPLVIT
jgi:iron complex transport system ATP-binding protein